MIFLCVLISSCCSYRNKQFNYDSNYIDLYKPYNENDTLRFINNEGIIESFLISKFDSSMNCGGFMGLKKKQVIIEIQHLSPPFLKEDLIAVEKFPNENVGNQYSVIINFNELIGEIKNVTLLKTDRILVDYGVTKYWEINSIVPAEKNKPNDIIKILWTEKYGLTRFYRNNGMIYNLII